MSNKEAILFAVLILSASRIREDSYDRITATNTINDNIYNNNHIDFMQFYKKTMQEAAREACLKEEVPFLMMPVYLALENTYNDILAWATDISFYKDNTVKISSPEAIK